MMIFVAASSGVSRMRFAIVNPSSPGSIRSSRTRSGFIRLASASPSSPREDDFTSLKPAPMSAISNSMRIVESSSTINIFASSSISGSELYHMAEIAALQATLTLEQTFSKLRYSLPQMRALRNSKFFCAGM